MTGHALRVPVKSVTQQAQGMVLKVDMETLIGQRGRSDQHGA